MSAPSACPAGYTCPAAGMSAPCPMSYTTKGTSSCSVCEYPNYVSGSSCSTSNPSPGGYYMPACASGYGLAVRPSTAYIWAKGYSNCMDLISTENKALWFENWWEKGVTYGTQYNGQSFAYINNMWDLVYVPYPCNGMNNARHGVDVYGRFSNYNRLCAQCPIGTYQVNFGDPKAPVVSICVNCPANNTSPVGSTSITQCSLCTYGAFPYPNPSDGVYCQCARGAYNHLAMTQCTSCASGTYNPNTGATACIACPAGSYCAAGSSAPVLCQAGYYCPNAASAAVACPAGYTCPTTGMTAPCPMSHTTKGTSSCSVCEYPSYVSGTTCSTSNPSPSGYYIPACASGYGLRIANKYWARGYKDCLSSDTTKYTLWYENYWSYSAPYGTSYIGASFFMLITQTTKVWVDVRYYNPCSYTSKTSYSTTYSVNKAGPENQNPICDICPRGTYASNLGTGSVPVASICVPCSRGYTSPPGSTSSAACTACTYGWFPMEDASNGVFCDCAKGSYNSLANTVCTACASGKYSSQTGFSVCYNCSVGSYTSAAGRSSCSLCAVGTYSNTPGVSTCSPCPAGWYTGTSGTAQCTRCPSGTYSNATGFSVCVTCLAGTYCPVGSINPAVCSVGFYCPAGGTVPIACPAGYTCPAAGMSAPCPMSYTTKGTSTCSVCVYPNYVSGTSCSTSNVPSGYYIPACASGYGLRIANKYWARGYGSCMNTDYRLWYENFWSYTATYGSTYVGNSWLSGTTTWRQVKDINPCNASYTDSSYTIEKAGPENLNPICDMCPRGTYASNVGVNNTPLAYICVPCADGYTSLPGSSSSSACTLCAYGSFPDTPSNGAFCYCGAGYYHTLNQTTCMACPRATYQPAPAQTFCYACTVLFFVSNKTGQTTAEEACSNVWNGLVAWYSFPLDDRLADASNTLSSLTDTSPFDAATYMEDGPWDNSQCAFLQSGQSFTMPNLDLASYYHTGYYGFSICLWYYIVNDFVWNINFMQVANDYNDTLSILRKNGNLNIRHALGSYLATLVSTRNTWTHVCIVFDAGVMTVYQNATVSASLSIPTFTHYPFTNNILGGTGNMLLDEVRIYSFALPQLIVDMVYKYRDYQCSNSSFCSAGCYCPNATRNACLNLIAYYPFTLGIPMQDAAHTVGDLVGTFQTTVTHGQWTFSSAMLFDSNPGFTVPEISLPSVNISVCLWLKFSYASNGMTVFQFDSTNFKLYASSTTTLTFTRTSTTRNFPAAITTQWRHICISDGSSGLSIYDNSVLVANAITQPTAKKFTTNYIGKTLDVPTAFNGYMDEFRIYSQTLTQVHVSDLYLFRSYMCPQGAYCQVGVTAPVLCPLDTYQNFYAMTTCTACTTGTFIRTSGATSQSCKTC